MISVGLRETRLDERKIRRENSSVAINLKSPDAERLIRELAELTNETITDAIQYAVRDRLTRERLRSLGGHERTWARVQRIQERIAQYPDLTGSAD